MCVLCCTSSSQPTTSRLLCLASVAAVCDKTKLGDLWLESSRRLHSRAKYTLSAAASTVCILQCVLPANIRLGDSSAKRWWRTRNV